MGTTHVTCALTIGYSLLTGSAFLIFFSFLYSGAAPALLQSLLSLCSAFPATRIRFSPPAALHNTFIPFSLFFRQHRNFITP